MLDPNLLRSQPELVAAALAKRGLELDQDALVEIDRRRKALQVEMETLRSERNALSRSIGVAKREGREAIGEQERAIRVGERVAAIEAELAEILASWDSLVRSLPNLPHPDVPDGQDASENRLVRQWGTPEEPGFTPKDHVDLGSALGIMDFAAGVRLAGTRFVVLRGAGARLERALIQFMLDLHTAEHGYEEIAPPLLANTPSLFGTGQLPKFEEDLFALRNDPYYLIPTAEVPLTNLLRDEIVPDLPRRFCAFTPCFRREAGAAGRDTRGMIRQHQFDKVELVQVVRPEDSDAALESLAGHAEEVLRRLELPYRVMLLCAGDMGFAAAKTYDLEVWLPSQRTYREISSCSIFGDFQARRLQLRYRGPDGKPQLAHTLNGSGLAVGRTLVALLENHQTADGRIRIPGALRPYIGGQEFVGGEHP